MIAITGASGQLGRLVVLQLLKQVPATELVAVVRDASKAADLAARGVQIRTATYDDPASLELAFAGAERVLLVSSNDLGNRVTQHGNAIAAAKRAGAGQLVYTSVLHADRSPLGLAQEHYETEKLIAASGLPHSILRNGWYTENYTASLPGALANGALLGSAGEGRISSAARQDYAEAAAAVLTRPIEAARVFELAGDDSYTLAEFAAEVSRQSGKELPYRNLPEAEYAAILKQIGLPAPLADLIADSDRGASQGGLFDDGNELSRLIGHATTPLADSVKAALAG
ncbi:SDR family oxidoreductase [Luteolibacter sp. GHJ8]|uniref:SDR family oxidoreductase n=1 Tax=Luteolibacter rhizosphaerae TaxID=2989719 RepID=A0ABT3G797_9BACT|nr:SDR family oxidoreductase [Luteolibacter rhizosphaerae]MCW1915727.1 SDR family oxidoreductase [Luteolibacter rhizosphaerae]